MKVVSLQERRRGLKVTQGRSGQERVQQEEHWYGCSGVWLRGGVLSENGNRLLNCPHVGSVLEEAESTPLFAETGIVVDVGKQLRGAYILVPLSFQILPLNINTFSCS